MTKYSPLAGASNTFASKFAWYLIDISPDHAQTRNAVCERRALFVLVRVPLSHSSWTLVNGSRMKFHFLKVSQDRIAVPKISEVMPEYVTC